MILTNNLSKKEALFMLDIPPYSFTQSKDKFIKFFIENYLNPFHDDATAHNYFEAKYDELPKLTAQQAIQYMMEQVTFQEEPYTFTAILPSFKETLELEFTINVTLLHKLLHQQPDKLRHVNHDYFYNKHIHYHNYGNEILNNKNSLKPLILLKTPLQDDPDAKLVLDGSHRLSTNFYKSADLLPYYILTVSDLTAMPDLFFSQQDRFLLKLIFDLHFFHAMRKLNPQFSDLQLLNQLTTTQEH